MERHTCINDSLYACMFFVYIYSCFIICICIGRVEVRLLNIQSRKKIEEFRRTAHLAQKGWDKIEYI